MIANIYQALILYFINLTLWSSYRHYHHFTDHEPEPQRQETYPRLLSWGWNLTSTLPDLESMSLASKGTDMSAIAQGQLSGCSPAVSLIAWEAGRKLFSPKIVRGHPFGIIWRTILLCCCFSSNVRSQKMF